MKQSALLSFRQVFETLYPDMVKVALFYIHDNAIAEDIVQEAFAKLWENYYKSHRIENLKGYLQYAVKNRCLNYLSHRQVVDKYQQEYLHQAAEDDESPEDYIQLVKTALEKLPPKRKLILERSVIDAKSYLEIAQELDISVNTVKDHIKKAYAFLRQEMNKEISGYILYLALNK